MATLGDAGFHLEAPQDLLAWARQDLSRVLLLTMQSSSDWALLTELRDAGPDVLVIAVLPDTSTAACVRALLAGAVAVVARDAPPESVKQVFEAVVAASHVPAPARPLPAHAGRQPDRGAHAGAGTGLAVTPPSVAAVRQ